MEGNRKELRHDHFMTKIKNELEILKNLGISNHPNIWGVEYIDAKGEKRPCFELNRDGMLQMLNSESVFTRYKTIEYIGNLEKQIKQLQNDNKELYDVATSPEDLELRQYHADRVKYAINNIEKLLLECDYTNIVATVDKIVEVHTNLYVKDRYKAHQDTVKYGNKGDNLYVNHVKSIIENKLDKIRPSMTLKDSNINAIMITKARQLRKEIESSKNISNGKEIGKYKRKLNRIIA